MVGQGLVSMDGQGKVSVDGQGEVSVDGQGECACLVKGKVIYAHSYGSGFHFSGQQK